MKYRIVMDGETKAEIPSNINKEKLLEFLKVYLFNEEYQWKKIEVLIDD